MAATEAKITLNINGTEAVGHNPLVVNHSTMVPIRSVSLLPNVKVDWNNKTKTVIITDTETKDILRITIGNKTALAGSNKVTLDTPATIIEGSTYVPFRFIGEALGAYVQWDAESKTVIIIRTDNTLTNALDSGNMVEMRNAALKLPRISLGETLPPSEEGGAGGNYYFRYGESKSFLYLYRGKAEYYEVKNGASWLSWEGQISSTEGDGEDLIPNIVPSIGKEWGIRPVFEGKVNYFMELWKIGEVRYGTYDEQGNIIFENVKPYTDGQMDIIAEIPDET
ncbi:copper amine oxidase N-terminal domain-containing protein [Paenibacillus sp. MSJ-34]|uniref:copper amine oxidase N-terminal domain-containing protein n=1 Tax=Paenibacillus sp. MSJ-34 TaxID=2841529 RepID=UPI001C10F058|nr:copper amine oxidase N-terminal domain-containing protein [Paenibacillus sp. MSJ-34]MBU5441507.1 copper amine oxidase N-terminal domain-containing protein [Paenibacillus sp. MSJ-34]